MPILPSLILQSLPPLSHLHIVNKYVLFSYLFFLNSTYERSMWCLSLGVWLPSWDDCWRNLFPVNNASLYLGCWQCNYISSSFPSLPRSSVPHGLSVSPFFLLSALHIESHKWGTVLLRLSHMWYVVITEIGAFSLLWLLLSVHLLQWTAFLMSYVFYTYTIRHSALGTSVRL